MAEGRGLSWLKGGVTWLRGCGVVVRVWRSSGGCHGREGVAWLSPTHEQHSPIHERQKAMAQVAFVRWVPWPRGCGMAESGVCGLEGLAGVAWLAGGG